MVNLCIHSLNTIFFEIRTGASDLKKWIGGLRFLLILPYFLNSVMGLGPSSVTVLTTSVMTAAHFAPSDAETNVILKRRSSRPMLFIKRLTMNIRFADL